jgi:hypothetical protein
MAGNDSLHQNPNTGTIPGYQPPPSTTEDPYAKKVVTEMELGKMTMWAWGAGKSSLSSRCPKYGDIVSASNNTINATGPVNGVAETSYKIITSSSPGSNNKLLKRESVTKTSIKCSFNVSHSLTVAPGDYYIRFYLTHSTGSSIILPTSAESVCTFTGQLIPEPGRQGWKDYTVNLGLTNLINGGNINRNAYVCLELYNTDWGTTKRYVEVGVKKWNSSTSSWDDHRTAKQSENKVNAIKVHLGITWRSLVQNRYRITFQLDDDKHK